jgi:hypothetical protein
MDREESDINRAGKGCRGASWVELAKGGFSEGKDDVGVSKGQSKEGKVDSSRAGKQ